MRNVLVVRFVLLGQGPVQQLLEQLCPVLAGLGEKRPGAVTGRTGRRDVLVRDLAVDRQASSRRLA